MPFKKDTGFSLNKLTNVYNTADLGTSIGRQPSTPSGSSVVASGGTLFVDGAYYYHVFKESDTFVTPPAWDPSTNVDYLVVGGGGPNGGAGDMTGGGGGGGVTYGTGQLFVDSTIYPVTMTDPIAGANSGADTTLTTGASPIVSGGGAYAPRSTGGLSGSPQSNAGGDAYPYSGSPPNIVNGGGGGAGGTGTTGTSAGGGGGGNGLGVPAFPGPVIGPHLNIPAPATTEFENAVGPTGLYGGGGGAGTYGAT